MAPLGPAICSSAGGQMVGQCCAFRRKKGQAAWRRCKGSGLHQIHQADVVATMAFTQNPNLEAEEHSFMADVDNKDYCCADCTVLALRATASPYKKDATGKEKETLIRPQDVLHDIQMIGGYKDTSRPLRKKAGEQRTPQSFYDDVVRWKAEQKEAEQKADAAMEDAHARRPEARRVTCGKAMAAAAPDKPWKLDDYWEAARPLMPDDELCFAVSSILRGHQISRRLRAK